MIAWHILVLSTFLSLVWGWHLKDTSRDWLEARAARPVAADPALRRVELVHIRRELGDALRNLVAAICLLSISVAYVFRTAVVLAGLGEAFAGQVVFFALVGVNVTGALFVVVSRRVI